MTSSGARHYHSSTRRGVEPELPAVLEIPELPLPFPLVVPAVLNDADRSFLSSRSCCSLLRPAEIQPLPAKVQPAEVQPAEVAEIQPPPEAEVKIQPVGMERILHNLRKNGKKTLKWKKNFNE